MRFYPNINKWKNKLIYLNRPIKKRHGKASFHSIQSHVRFINLLTKHKRLHDNVICFKLDTNLPVPFHSLHISIFQYFSYMNTSNICSKSRQLTVKPKPTKAFDQVMLLHLNLFAFSPFLTIHLYIHRFFSSYLHLADTEPLLLSWKGLEERRSYSFACCDMFSSFVTHSIWSRSKDARTE